MGFDLVSNRIWLTFQPPKRRATDKKQASKKKLPKRKSAHPISSSSADSDSSDHGHGEDPSRPREDPPSEEEREEDDWEDVEESDREMDHALVESLYKAIDDAKKTGPPFRKKERRILRAMLDVAEMPS